MNQAVYGQRKRCAGAFWGGLFTGLILAALIGAGGAYYLYQNPEKVAGVAAKEANRAVKRTVESIPQDYLAAREAEISKIFSDFVKAYSKGQIQASQMDDLMQAGFGAAADQKVTPKEMDGLIEIMKKVLYKKDSEGAGS